jgi:hypothetical protein
MKVLTSVGFDECGKEDGFKFRCIKIVLGGLLIDR